MVPKLVYENCCWHYSKFEDLLFGLESRLSKINFGSCPAIYESCTKKACLIMI